MSRYDNNEKDDLCYVLEEFMENHTTSELLEIVSDVIRLKEYDEKHNEVN